LFPDLDIGYDATQCDFITSLLYVMKVEENQCGLLKAKYKLELTEVEQLLMSTEKTYDKTLAGMKTIVANYQTKVDDYIEES
jgi:hypothetical protein